MDRSGGLTTGPAAPEAGGLPQFLPVARRLHQAPLSDVAAAVRQAVGDRVRACRGRKVALAVGSRGIDQLPRVVGALVELLRGAGALPFIVPAMGSHGGAHAAGQVAVLAKHGIAPGTVGTEVVGDDAPTLLEQDLPFSRAALEADLIVPVNRVKAHTILEGDWGSGLRKMSVVGLGLAAGATAAHTAGLTEDLERRFDRIRSCAPLGWGLALVEDGSGHLSGVTAADPQEYGKVDRELLVQARAHAPGSGFSHLDALILLSMGKEISGAGMDPDVIGRHRRSGAPAPVGAPWIGVLRLSEASGGNAIGVGMADMVSRRLAEAIDHQATAANAAASGWEAGAAIPAVAASDALLLAHACLPAGRRVVIARDTVHLDHVLVSPALAGDVERRADLDADGPARHLPLDQDGNLQPGLLFP